MLTINKEEHKVVSWGRKNSPGQLVGDRHVLPAARTMFANLRRPKWSAAVFQRSFVSHGFAAETGHGSGMFRVFSSRPAHPDTANLGGVIDLVSFLVGFHL
ncbi:hypothetical protein MLD38_016444 [Melastoma candidum]|uniref:Uncharacterized protein n=1 Tax=Melastoma candidum TaxID=119954 RepID=A0ACB9RSX7_9MYRT|nr:hypothetical protein MLD38_016444 [Melastoma candidum]